MDSDNRHQKKKNLDVVPNGRDVTDHVMRITQCCCKSQEAPHPWLQSSCLSVQCSTVGEASPGAVPRYKARCSHPSVIHQANEDTVSHLHGLVCLCSLDLCLYKPTLGSGLGTWPWGHGPDPKLARGDMNVLPDPFCPAAACDTTRAPGCKHNPVQIHHCEATNFS